MISNLHPGLKFSSPDSLVFGRKKTQMGADLFEDYFEKLIRISALRGQHPGLKLSGRQKFFEKCFAIHFLTTDETDILDLKAISAHFSSRSVFIRVYLW